MSKIRKSSRSSTFDIHSEEYKRAESVFSLFMNIDKRVRNTTTKNKDKHLSKDKQSKTHYAKVKARSHAGPIFRWDWIIRLLLRMVYDRHDSYNVNGELVSYQ